MSALQTGWATTLSHYRDHQLGAELTISFPLNVDEHEEFRAFLRTLHEGLGNAERTDDGGLVIRFGRRGELPPVEQA